MLGTASYDTHRVAFILRNITNVAKPPDTTEAYIYKHLTCTKPSQRETHAANDRGGDEWSLYCDLYGYGFTRGEPRLVRLCHWFLNGRWR